MIIQDNVRNSVPHLVAKWRIEMGENERWIFKTKLGLVICKI